MKSKYTLFLYILLSSTSIHAEVPNFELLKDRLTKNEESPDDLYNLAMIYRYDQKSKDLGLAKYYMTIAADKGHPDALYELGMMFILGGKVYKTDENGTANTTVYWDEDIEQGEHLLIAAAAKDNVKALVYLGYEYILGYKLNQDIDLGISCLKNAAELGDQTAQVYLGNAYRYGNKVQKDMSKGIYYMEMAAKQGSDEAILSLKNMK